MTKNIALYRQSSIDPSLENENDSENDEELIKL